MKNHYVYIHLKADTREPFYVGKGFGRRAWDKSHRSLFWKSTVKKHGHIVELLHTDLTEAEALSLEIIAISLFGRGNLCNFTNGGEGCSGRNLSPESRLKLSVSKKRNMTPETRKKMGDARRRWKFTEATKQKMREAISGRVLTEEWKQKIGEAGSKAVKTTCGISFKSAKSASEWLKLNGYPKADASSIGRCCKKKLPRAYGFKWVYAV